MKKLFLLTILICGLVIWSPVSANVLRTVAVTRKGYEISEVNSNNHKPDLQTVYRYLLNNKATLQVDVYDEPTYVKENGQEYQLSDDVRIYWINKAGKKVELVTETQFHGPPDQFYAKLTQGGAENIAKVSLGYMSYYINVLTGDIALISSKSIFTYDWPIDIIYHNKVSSLNIRRGEDSCYKESHDKNGERTYTEFKANTQIDAITLNERRLTGALTKPLNTFCYNSDMNNDDYWLNFNFKQLGANKDFAKLYFSLTSDSNELLKYDEDKNILNKNAETRYFSFQLKDGRTSAETKEATSRALGIKIK